MHQSAFGKVTGFITRNIKRIFIFLAITIVSLGVAFLVYDLAENFFMDNEYATYDKSGEKVIISVPKGASGQEIGELLESNGLIENASLFKWRAQLTGDTDGFQYGTYTFIKGMSYRDIVEILCTGSKAETRLIRILEGWTVEEIATYLQDENICTVEEFYAACNSYDFDFDYYDKITNPDDRYYLLEGYLHPETYSIVPANGAEGVVKRLLRQTEIIFEDTNRIKKMKKAGLTVDQVLIMAAALQHEFYNYQDMQKGARVFFNRMNPSITDNGRCSSFWQTDPTVSYGGFYLSGMTKYYNAPDSERWLTKWDEAWRTDKNNKYNTYMYQWPVGPICNPSTEAIDAVLNPANGKWLYFLAVNGKNYYYTNWDDFVAAGGGGM